MDSSDNTNRPKLRIHPSKHKEMRGFEDVVDFLTIDDIKKLENEGKQARLKDDSGMNLYSFLDDELKRLRKIDQLFTHTLGTATTYEQSNILIKKSEGTIELLHAEIINKILNDNEDPILRNFEILWNSTFGISKAE